ncbi:MAG: metallophosphoesterase [Polyangiales bacterium]
MLPNVSKAPTRPHAASAVRGLGPIDSRLRRFIAPSGRGAYYHPARRSMEWTLQRLYRGNWPAKLWQLWPRATQVQCVRRSFQLLAPSAAPLRIGFVSDTHVGPTTPPALLEAAFGCLAQERLDVLLLGGDYVYLEATPAKLATLTALIASVPAAHKFAVLGNHDLWTHHARIEAALRAGGARVLVNQGLMLNPRHGPLGLIGIDDPYTGEPDVSAALAEVDDPRHLIVLCHAPDGLPQTLAALSGDTRRGLYVCGHTHGGQIASPWGPLIVPGPVGRVYPHGFHDVGPLQLHVSRGVGATELPIRAFAPPEVAVIDLLPER